MHRRRLRRDAITRETFDVFVTWQVAAKTIKAPGESLALDTFLENREGGAKSTHEELPLRYLNLELRSLSGGIKYSTRILRRGVLDRERLMRRLEAIERSDRGC
ncbi:hypothetical protein KM043_011753 [Ampulex compressa]|nr:hypothetical protein KM043_011753 [Ampulex compressa]